jgi:hypothetical protein
LLIISKSFAVGGGGGRGDPVFALRFLGFCGLYSDFLFFLFFLFFSTVLSFKSGAWFPAHRVVVINDATPRLENEDVEQGLEDEEGTVKTARIIAINLALLLLSFSLFFSLSLSPRVVCAASVSASCAASAEK